MDLGNKHLADALRAALLREWEKPPRERFQALIDRGAIDKEGRVLIKGPFGEVEVNRKKRKPPKG